MKLFHLSLVSLVFVSSFSLALYNKPKINISPRQFSLFPSSLLPTLAKDASYPVLSAQAVVAIDPDSGVVLYQKDPDTKFLPASTTKIVTALVAVDSYDPATIVTIGNLSMPSDSQRMGLMKGEQITVDSLLQGLLIYSANDAAEALAATYPGGRDSFINAMNVKLNDLHLTNTHFTNPSGLDEEGHVATARDLVRIAQIAMQNPYFAKIVGTKALVVTSTDGKIVHPLKNINVLLGKVEGVEGVKTGWTENARENLVTYVNRSNKKVLIALLGSQDRFGETTELIDWVYKNYSWQEVPFYQKTIGLYKHQ